MDIKVEVKKAPYIEAVMRDVNGLSLGRVRMEFDSTFSHKEPKGTLVISRKVFNEDRCEVVQQLTMDNVEALIAVLKEWRSVLADPNVAIAIEEELSDAVPAQ